MLTANEEDRIYSKPPNSNGRFKYVLGGAFLAAAIVAAVILFMIPFPVDGTLRDRLENLIGYDPDLVLTALYSRLEIDPLPSNVANRQPLASHLAILRREPCDWKALSDFAGELSKIGYRREGAKAFIAFSNECRPSNMALYRAADILYGLSDLEAALNVANDVVAMSPDIAHFYFLRGQILEDSGYDQEAIDDYYSTIGLTNDLGSLNSSVFQRIASRYVALGKYCEAITPLQTWVSIDPVNNDTRRVQALIGEYGTKGQCEQSYAAGSDSFSTQGNDVIVAKVAINGVSGLFVVDTGATFVATTKDFARRAELPLSDTYSVRLQTANGVSLAQRATIAKVTIGRVAAIDVAAVILDDERALGNDIDGLLGRSFLSRFNVTFGADEWRIESKVE